VDQLQHFNEVSSFEQLYRMLKAGEFISCFRTVTFWTLGYILKFIIQNSLFNLIKWKMELFFFFFYIFPHVQTTEWNWKKEKEKSNVTWIKMWKCEPIMCCCAVAKLFWISLNHHKGHHTGGLWSAEMENTVDTTQSLLFEIIVQLWYPIKGILFLQFAMLCRI